MTSGNLGLRCLGKAVFGRIGHSVIAVILVTVRPTHFLAWSTRTHWGYVLSAYRAAASNLDTGIVGH